MTCYHIKGVDKDLQDFGGDTITSEGEIKEILWEDMASEWNFKKQVELGDMGWGMLGIQDRVAEQT